MCLQFCTNLWGCASCFRSWCRVCLHPAKNDKASRIQSAVWSCSNEVKKIFCVGMWQWMRHGFTHYTLETKWSLTEWTAAGESRPKRPKTQQWAGKVMASAHWDAHGILFIDCLEKAETINSDYYMALLNRLSAEITKKLPHIQKEKVLFHQNNAPCNKFMKTIPHPAYFSDLSPSDYWLFADLEKMLQGKRFGSNEEVVAEIKA